MATIKSYTTIKQSKHLVKLGLDPRTSDMFYATEIGVLIAEPPYEVEGHEPCIPFTPAWSLTALLELMHDPDLCKHTDGKWYITTYPCGIHITSFGKVNHIIMTWR